MTRLFESIKCIILRVYKHIIIFEKTSLKTIHEYQRLYQRIINVILK